ncbi:MAG: N-acetylmuramic acid 6-phosphate etherase [Planctomycetes bacterium]|nr:N-acetylmuramic acid 6-phosphate etherase [Planctomycetota bacterium]
MRTKRHLGCLVTERRNRRTRRIDSGTALQIIDAIQREDAEVLRAVRRVRKGMAQAVNWMTEALRSGGRLFYVGAGTSGRLGVLDAAECVPTYGTTPELVQGIIAGGRRALDRSVEGAEDSSERGSRAIRRRRVGPQDVVLGITASGSTPFVLGALEAARQQGCRTILLTFNPNQDREAADLILDPVVGPEVVTGSTRMKAGTATKLILNAMSTAAMIRLGKVYGNLMVDLRATNHKLRDRARRIVMELTGLNAVAAGRLLKRVDGDTKTAIVMARCGTSPRKAKKLLADAGGVLRRVIGDK